LGFGYYQLKILPEDIPKLHLGLGLDHYEFTVMHLGLTNAPMAFMDLTTRVSDLI